MTNTDVFERLAAEYRAKGNTGSSADRVRRLHMALLKQEEGGVKVADSLSVFSAAIAMPLINEHRLEAQALTPQMQEAWKLAYLNQPLTSLADYSPEQIAGFMNGWKGKYLEVLVRDQLNCGHWIGDLHLGLGETAHLATHINQPGWDLIITDAHGDILQELQIKATNSLNYIMKAFERYPDIPILTTDEVLDASGHISASFAASLSPTGFSNEDLTEQLSDAAGTLLDDGSVFDPLLDALPALPFVIIALGEGRQVLIGKKTLATALESGGERMAASGAALAVGAALAAIDFGVLSVPTVLLVKTSITRQFRSRCAIKRLEQGILRLKAASLNLRQSS